MGRREKQQHASEKTSAILLKYQLSAGFTCGLYVPGRTGETSPVIILPV